MTPVELLKSTQRAVATQSMIDMHEELKEFRKKQKEVQTHQASDEDTLKNLESRQQIQRADVERMREREELKTRLKFLEMTRPIPRYREAHRASKEARGRRTAIEKELVGLQREVEPALRAVNAKQQYHKRVEGVVKERKQHVAQSEREVEKVDSTLRSLNDQVDELRRQRGLENKSGRELKEEQKSIAQKIAEIQNQVERAPPEVDIASYNERIREKTRQLDEFQREGSQIQASMRDRKGRAEERQARVVRATTELKTLDSKAGIMANRLLRTSRDTAQAWEWIQNHQDQFEKPIFGPPLVECNVKDSKYVDIVESQFQRTAFLTFTAQTKNDFKKLSEKLHNSLHLSEVNIRTELRSLDEFRPPVARDELTRLGAQGWVIDFINGPEPVLAMLCAELRLHQVAVFRNDISDAQYEQLRPSAIENWATSKSTYKIIRRREYGDAATQTSVKDVRRATFWTEQPVDLTAKRELQENIDGWTYEVDELRKENQADENRIKGIRTECQRIQNDRKQLSDEKATQQKAVSEIKALPARLEQQQGKLSTAQQNIQAKKDRIRDIASEEGSLTLERARTALTLVDAVTALCESHTSLYESEILAIEASSDVETMSAHQSAVRETLETKKQNLKSANDEYLRITQEAKKIMQAIVVLQTNTDPDFRAFLQELNLKEYTINEHEAEIEGAKASLELVDEGNGGQVIKEYETRQMKIDQLKEKLGDCTHALEELGGKISELREKWEPELDELVGQISENFGYNMGHIGCAGEVSVHKDEDDFASWAIQILVKFRYVLLKGFIPYSTLFLSPPPPQHSSSQS